MIENTHNPLPVIHLHVNQLNEDNWSGNIPSMELNTVRNNREDAIFSVAIHALSELKTPINFKICEC